MNLTIHSLHVYPCPILPSIDLQTAEQVDICIKYDRHCRKDR